MSMEDAVSDADAEKAQMQRDLAEHLKDVRQ